MTAVLPERETWRAVPGWEGYEVSDQGCLRSLARTVVRRNGAPQSIRGRVLCQAPAESGHLRSRLTRGGVSSTVYVHRLVLEAFVGPAPEGTEACHANGDPTDNRLENLRWDTRSANNFDQIAHGTHGNGSKTHCKRGHEFTPENTYRTRDGRSCRQCIRIRAQRMEER